MNIYKNISRVENFFSMLLTKANITDNLFIGNIPATIDANWNDMILVDVMAIKDFDAYAEGSVNIFLYAKSTDGQGTKPIKKLYAMEMALTEAINNCNDRNYAVDINFRDADYDSNRNYYLNIINLKITVRRLN